MVCTSAGRCSCAFGAVPEPFSEAYRMRSLLIPGLPNCAPGIRSLRTRILTFTVPKHRKSRTIVVPKTFELETTPTRPTPSNSPVCVGGNHRGGAEAPHMGHEQPSVCPHDCALFSTMAERLMTDDDDDYPSFVLKHPASAARSSNVQVEMHFRAGYTRDD